MNMCWAKVGHHLRGIARRRSDLRALQPCLTFVSRMSGGDHIPVALCVIAESDHGLNSPSEHLGPCKVLGS